MKALTIQQPWAWSIIHGGKNIENRTTNWKYRGPLLIHAARDRSLRGLTDEHVNAAWDAVPDDDPTRVLRLGFIIGVVDLVDIHPDDNCCRPWGLSRYAGKDNVLHLVLENPRQVEPVRCQGRLGIWECDWAPADDAEAPS